MPGLADIACPTHTVQISNDVAVTVRGLYFNDILSIFREHKAAALLLFDAATSSVKAGEAQADDVTSVAAMLAQHGPGLAAAVIAHASDEPGMVESAARLPFVKQVELLESIFGLTLEREGGFPNVVASVTRVAEAVTKMLNGTSD